MAVLLGWPLLYLFRVRPAWRIAAVAAILLLILWFYALKRAGDPFMLVLLSGPIAYAGAAGMTLPNMAWRWRVVIAFPFLALFAIAVFFPG
ncbi:hypothetical protein [Nonomuraea endophytica]|uniref:hypothetical protein n=1 Tax=Nonomuraea endophytica TaxID=714136 RepID=UPI0037CB6E7B